MNSRHVHLISAPFCCGLSWMASVLTELNVRTSHFSPQRYPHGIWEPLPGQPGWEQVNHDGLKHLGFCIPRLLRNNQFQLEPNLEVIWEHRLDFAREAGVPTLLFTRDPRDAIHSLYLRNYLPTPWNVYLDRPEDWRDHFPGMFGLPPADTWAAWHAFWIGLADQGLRPMLILRYEDSKTDPVGMTHRVLEFLGIRRSHHEILKAVEESTFEKTRLAMEKHEKATGTTMRVARRGQVGEWKEFMDAESHARFAGPARAWMERLGYTPVESPTNPHHNSLQANVQASSLEGDHPITQAVQNWTRGGPTDAVRKACLETLAQRGGTVPERLAAALEWVPLDWTQKCLGSDIPRGSLTQAVLDQFRNFLRTHQNWLPVQQMLLNAVQDFKPVSSQAFGTLTLPPTRQSLDLPAIPSIAQHPEPAESLQSTEGTPVLIDPDYKGYRLYGWRGRFVAITSTFSDPLWFRWNQVERSQHEREGTLVSADLSFELKEKVDRAIQAKPGCRAA